MNRTTKVAIALIVAAGLSTMVYAVPEQRAMAHLRLSSDPSDYTPDDFPFGPNPPSASKSDPPANNPDPPPSGNGPPLKANCVDCITTQMLTNASVTNPKLASGSVLSANIGAGAVATPNIADHAITTPKIAPGAVSLRTQETVSKEATVQPGQFVGLKVQCPSGWVVTGGGFSGAVQVHASSQINPLFGNGWEAQETNTSPSVTNFLVYATCALINP